MSERSAWRRSVGWAQLATPLADCAGRQLELTVSSMDATTGNAVTVWAYPSYYEGWLAQRSVASDLWNLSLGLEMNRGRS